MSKPSRRATTQRMPEEKTNDERLNRGPKDVALAVANMFLAAFMSVYSQMTMAPVFGGIPAAVNHDLTLAISAISGFVLGRCFQPASSRYAHLALLVWTSFVPIFQRIVHGSSEYLGATRGPQLSGFLSYQVIAFAASFVAAHSINRLLGDTSTSRRDLLYVVLVGLSIGAMFGVQRVAQTAMVRISTLWTFPSLIIGSYSPLKAFIGIFNGFVLLSTWTGSNVGPYIWLSMLPQLYLAFDPHLNTQYTNSILQDSLYQVNWTLIHRTWSRTGYIAVVEDTELHYRALRCDHSLLGGEWIATESRRQQENWKVNEPIYHVFEMLEAVRLIETQPKIQDSTAKALVIGLGIGTAPKALIQHGINTTILELDPAVHEYAIRYFGLPKNHNAVLKDAVAWVKSENDQQRLGEHDYILHDVFTGGAEPLALFTHEFLYGLRQLLKPNGIAAINYAAHLGAPLTRKVLHTIDTVFNGQCKAYGDAETSADQDGFMNMVVFCRNSPGPITFRKPIKADFLESISRPHYLSPNPDHQIEIPGRTENETTELLIESELSTWNAQQTESAIRHWKVMRTVLPAKVWELW